MPPDRSAACERGRLPIAELPELIDTGQFAEPREWTQGYYGDIGIGQAIGGGWAAGHGPRALMTMSLRHRAAGSSPRRTATSSPALPGGALRRVRLPASQDRHARRLVRHRFESGSIAITINGPEFAQRPPLG